MNKIKIFSLFLLACFCSLAQSTPGAIYSPPAGSMLGSPLAFSWGASAFRDQQPDSYFFEMGTHGCFSNDFYAGSWTIGNHIGIFGTQPPVTDVTATVYYYSDPNNMSARCTNFSSSGPGAIIFPAIPQNISNVSQIFPVVTNSYPFYVSAGYSDFGAVEYMNHTAAYSSSFQIPIPIPYKNVHEFLYIRLEQGGVTKDYQFVGPLAPTSGTLNASELPGLIGNDDFTGAFGTQPTSGNPMVGPAATARPSSLRGAYSGTPPEVATFTAAHTVEGGEYRYTYNVDTRKVQLFRIGEPLESAPPSMIEQPKGWASARFMFAALEGAEKAKNSRFTLTSSWRPGLVLVELRSPDALGEGMGVNTKPQFAIGPAFAPELSRAAILDRVKGWAEDYGFKFLSPLLEGKELNDLAPESPLEQEIVECLRAVLQ
ncbi:MAG TPA: hypothetical protein VN794_19710 [Methylomirabilota bacterium]|nr:hypothetical protein [Methylomirabilota bacterium]